MSKSRKWSESKSRLQTPERIWPSNEKVEKRPFGIRSLS